MKHFGYFDRSKSRIRIIQNEELSEIEIHQCIQCDERSCVEACPTGSLSIHPEYGHIVHAEGTCIQCRKCYKACRHHGVFWDEERNYPLICDLCGGEPECLKPCRLHQALRLNPQEVRK
jgi:Fe-S-cluster-containing hydrogenase component 2